MKGIVVKILPAQFEILVGENRALVSARGKLKLKRNIMLGDVIEFKNDVICDILPQKII